VPADRPITVQDLMRHTAGLVYADRTSSPRLKQLYDKSNIEAAEVDISGDEMLRRLSQIPLGTSPERSGNIPLPPTCWACSSSARP
jgi:CubicO group peptidase (beta-lactamase class C family)